MDSGRVEKESVIPAPTAGNIIVEFIKVEETYGEGIIVRPETYKTDYDKATVLAIGPDVRERNETVRTAPIFHDGARLRAIAPGDVVVVKKRYGEDRFEFESKDGKGEATFIKFSDVRGVEK